METLQHILDNSKFILFEEVKDIFMNWYSMNNYLRNKFNLPEKDTGVPYLVIFIEDDKIVKIGFTKSIINYLYYNDFSDKRYFLKDLTAENISYNNFREYKQKYTNQFIKYQ